jgi:signal transduction histidine kinase
MVGKVLWEIFPQTLGSEIEKQMRRTMEERTVAHFNFLSVVQPGVWNEEEIYPTHEGIAVFARDITERRQAEDGLREANRHKDEFLAMLAHELRNPLAPIRNAVYSLNQQNAGDSGRQRQGQVIERQVGHMSRLLDDLLDVSRLTRGKITLHKCGVAVADVLNHAMEIVQPLAADRGQELLFTLPAPDVHVHGDPDRLTQAVGNLLTNAVKYTPEGGKIWLTAGQENNQAVVRVRDTGMGITPDILPYIFDLFTQEKRSLDRSQGGLGIGLTVVRNLVQLHGGTIEARSTGKGEGSEFIIRLPLLLDAPDRPCPEKHSSRQVLRARRRVLVVDDAEDAAESLAEVVSAWGHSVQIAHDGPSALEAVHAFQPEVVLLDIGLPGMNGYEVAREIRKEFSDSIELIALTGYGQATDRKESQAAGFHAHLVKPVDLDVLKQLVGTAA